MRYFPLGHVYRQVGSIMDESQFQMLMEEIKKSQREVEGKLTSSRGTLSAEDLTQAYSKDHEV